MAYTALFGANSATWNHVTAMADKVAAASNEAVANAAATDFSDPGAVVLLQMRINQVTNAATAVSNLVKAIQEPSKNAVNNLR